MPNEEVFEEIPEETPVRPEEFYWHTAKNSGSRFKLSADEWNDLTSNINEVREYKGLSRFDFTWVYPGDDVTADIYNEARSAIRGIPGYGSYIDRVYPGDDITAYSLNILVSELNVIP